MLLAGLMLLSPWNAVLNAVTRTDVAYSVERQAPYLALSERLLALKKSGGEHVYVVSQTENSPDFVTLHSRLRPYVVGNEPSCLAVRADSDVPGAHVLSPGDFWTKLAGGYDYLVLYKSSESFARDYGELFEEPQRVADRQLYRVDKEAQKLVLIE